MFLHVYRAKDLALVSLQVLSLMIQSLLLQDEPSSPSDRDILLGAVATWRTFLPGIFGNLFAGCRSSGVQRYFRTSRFVHLIWRCVVVG